MGTWWLGALLAAAMAGEPKLDDALRASQAGNHLTAVVLFEQVRAQGSQDPRVDLHEAVALERLGLFESAVHHHLLGAAAGHARSLEALVLLGEEEGLLEVVRRLDPAALPPLVRSHVARIDAENLYATEDGVAALARLEDVQRPGPDCGAATWLTGRIHLEAGRTDEAVWAFGAPCAPPPPPTTPGATWWAASPHATGARHRDRDRALLGLASAHSRAGAYALAAASAERVPDDGATTWQARILLGEIALASGDTAAALKHGKKLVKATTPRSGEAPPELVPEALLFVLAEASARCQSGPLRGAATSLQRQLDAAAAPLGKLAEGASWTETRDRLGFPGDVEARMRHHRRFGRLATRLMGIWRERRVLEAQKPAWRRSAGDRLLAQLEPLELRLRAIADRYAAEAAREVLEELAHLEERADALVAACR